MRRGKRRAVNVKPQFADVKRIIRETLGKKPLDVGNESDVRKVYLALLTSIPIRDDDAAKLAGRRGSAMRKWAQEDPVFAAAREKALNVQSGLRVDVVENALFSQIQRGIAPGGVTVFWLKVHGGRKYREADKLLIDHEGKVEVVIEFCGGSQSESEGEAASKPA
jgi:hypothetical protein